MHCNLKPVQGPCHHATKVVGGGTHITKAKCACAAPVEPSKVDDPGHRGWAPSELGCSAVGYGNGEVAHDAMGGPFGGGGARAGGRSDNDPTWRAGKQQLHANWTTVTVGVGMHW